MHINVEIDRSALWAWGPEAWMIKIFFCKNAYSKTMGPSRKNNKIYEKITKFSHFCSKILFYSELCAPQTVYFLFSSTFYPFFISSLWGDGGVILSIQWLWYLASFFLERSALFLKIPNSFQPLLEFLIFPGQKFDLSFVLFLLKLLHLNLND